MPGAVNTSYTFTATDVITSGKMNDILAQSFMTETAIVGGTLEVASNKLKVKSQGITSNELAAGAVNATSIADGAVTPGKLANSDFGDFTVASGVATLDANVVTTAKILDANVTTAKIADANITAAKLDGAQTGTAPIYGVRAFARVQGNGTFQRNVGFSSIAKVSGGVYDITLTSVPPTLPIIVATCHTPTGNAFNFSAVVQINSSSAFTVKTGFEDVAALSDSDFSIMVIY